MEIDEEDESDVRSPVLGHQTHESRIPTARSPYFGWSDPPSLHGETDSMAYPWP